MVTINTYNSVQNAYIDKAFLDSEGITSLILDSNMSGLGPFGAQVIGGIRLQVEDHQATQALRILEEHGISSNGRLAFKCPNCNSFNTKTKNHISFENAYRRLIHGEKKAILFHSHHCEVCKHIW